MAPRVTQRVRPSKLGWVVAIAYKVSSLWVCCRHAMRCLRCSQEPWDYAWGAALGFGTMQFSIRVWTK